MLFPLIKHCLWFPRSFIEKLKVFAMAHCAMSDLAILSSSVLLSVFMSLLLFSWCSWPTLKSFNGMDGPSSFYSFLSVWLIPIHLLGSN